MSLSLETIQKEINLAPHLEQGSLIKLADSVVEGYNADCLSRADWWLLVSKSMDIAKQVWEEKQDPFPKASNVKFPLITQAIIDFASRQYPQLIQNDRVVRMAVTGSDPDDTKYLKGERVCKCMNAQLLGASCNWEEETDKLLHVLPMVGTCFRKVYYHLFDDYPVSELCEPEFIVVNNKIKSLDSAPRITHKISLSSNMIRERIMAGIFSDISIDSLYDGTDPYAAELDAPIDLLEQHCFADLDGDGYKEPYIITVHEQSRQVLRIVNRIRDIEKTSDGKLKRIIPEQYFTDYHYIRSVDGSYYSIGFGVLLYPLNESINTTINQLLDAGTLNNYQSGFISSGLRLKNGNFRLNLNEWKVVQTPVGMRLQDAMAPLPTKEPSMTLLNLLQLLINVGKDLTSTNDLMQGKGQTQNVPATTTLSMLEQGMKVYNAIGKRLFLALKKEFKRIFYLNSKYLSNETYTKLLDDELADVKQDFDETSMDVFPVADPNMASQTQRIAKAQAVMTLPSADPHQAGIYYLKSLGIEQTVIDKVLPEPDPQAPPPPEVQKTMAEIQKILAEAQKSTMDAQVVPVQIQLDVAKSQQDAKESDSRIAESEGRTAKSQHDAAVNEARLHVDASKIQVESQDSQGKAVLEHVTQQNVQKMKEKEVELQTILKYQELLQNKDGKQG